jgi:hypothetical protein
MLGVGPVSLHLEASRRDFGRRRIRHSKSSWHRRIVRPRGRAPWRNAETLSILSRVDFSRRMHAHWQPSIDRSARASKPGHSRTIRSRQHLATGPIAWALVQGVTPEAGSEISAAPRVRAAASRSRGRPKHRWQRQARTQIGRHDGSSRPALRLDRVTTGRIGALAR